jgi:ribosomal protein S27AE
VSDELNHSYEPPDGPRLICDHCGRSHVKAIELSDSTRLECEACGSVEWVWKDNELEIGLDGEF